MALSRCDLSEIKKNTYTITDNNPSNITTIKPIIFKDYIVDHKGNTFISARIVTTNTPKSYVADIQRSFDTVKSDGNNSVYKFPTSYGRYKFKIDETYPITKKIDSTTTRIISKATNHSEYKSIFLNPYSYEDIFKIPVSELFPSNSYNFENISVYNEMLKENKSDLNVDGLDDLKKMFLEKNPKKNVIGFDIEAIEYLEKLFSVDKVYRLSNYCYKSMEQNDILSKTATLLHINHFGGVNKKYINMEENTHNITLMFWLFNDILVVSEQSGLRTW